MSELTVVDSITSEDAVSALQALQLKSTEDSIPKTETPFKMAITISDSKARFWVSKLKIILNYLRTIMAQERLDRWALLSIEREAASSIDYRDLSIV